ncbi:MAG: hypothetical protein L0332_29045 [Chloroflexi bacterium]|nr:hypothetical protein [Chloroflexota bacterium]MCI0649453.1 hypothetical protein [Chloroflexota bacterium]MCI0730747.1 hypothetical protein [Chloroflexota bacterium]
MASWKNRFLGQGLYVGSRLVRHTGRYRVSGLEYLWEQKASGRPVILAAWHGMTMMLAGFFLRHYDMQSLVLILPDDWRGEALSVWAGKIGARPMPMNLKGDATMASARQLARLVRLVREGCDCYITPDGPDGPAYVIKPGIIYIAQKAAATILPLGAYARHGYRLNRWDRYTVPYPYSRISITIGPPLATPAGTDVPAATEALTNALHRATAQAAANYYEQRP